MKYLKFFDEIESILLKDELAKFLGVNEDGIIELTYTDIVKMAEHSCATVAEGYLIALKVLKQYADEYQKRRNKGRNEKSAH